MIPYIIFVTVIKNVFIKKFKKMLKRVDADALIELKQPRINPDAPIIKYCEDLTVEWMETIENILSDICDERYFCLNLTQ